MAVLGEGGGSKKGYKPPKGKTLGAKAPTPPATPKKGDSGGGWTEVKTTPWHNPRANERGSAGPFNFKFDDQKVDTKGVFVLPKGGRLPPLSKLDQHFLAEVKVQARTSALDWLVANPGMAPVLRSSTTPRPRTLPPLQTWRVDPNRRR